jgi:hypothetical protein
MVQWSGNSDMLDQGCYIGLVTHICRTRDGSEVLYQRYTGPGMVRRFGNRLGWYSCLVTEMDQGGYSCLVTEICKTRDVIVSGNRDMQDQGWDSGLLTDICRTRDGTVVW